MSTNITSTPTLEQALPDTSGPYVRPLEAADFDAVIDINQGALEGVGPLDRESLAALVAEADDALVLDDDGAIAGFVITLPPGADYDSSRYRWFEDRLKDYVYLDRIVTASTHRRQGVASRLYDAIEGDLPIGLEIYETNDGSIAFHTGRGYREVGRLEHEGKVNLMMLRTR
ncbi:GNAT family N-acetyltransferase [Aeromicrobium sp. Leaf350]|uniref:GNAT family N-acetyltransferase n=1 Tax=Aeromicrobium sp. Leaf350 TaxID=2876565 RepID=UPI001E44A4D2|nr:GNAT family N-acetyltransferase [Aeromicrobium sp. Leaf350]